MSDPNLAHPDHFELPVPETVAIEHSRRLVAEIVDLIDDKGGVIDFREYMDLALYSPGLGYYSGGSAKLGRDGDFVTAPEISPLFGGCLAIQFEKLFAQGCGLDVLEFGAGSGKLCADILRRAPGIENYLILDLSSDLISRQRHYLETNLPAHLFGKVAWLHQLPQNFNGIVLANEVADAMPIHRLLKRQHWCELGVEFDGNRFRSAVLATSGEAVRAMSAIEARYGHLHEGYCTEVNLNYKPWLSALSQSINRAAVFIIDYGYEQGIYYHPDRREGSLICHYRHRAHADPFVYPGLQDITAFVDFDALADAAELNDFELVGLVDQGEFLLSNGLLEIAAKMCRDDDHEARFNISQQIKTLSLPTEMGEKFKVLALQKNLQLEMNAMRRGLFHG